MFKKISCYFILFAMFLFLLFFPEHTLSASKTALLLWFDILLPTLLPFMILSQVILKTPVLEVFCKFSGPFFRKIFHCSDSGAFCMLCGFLCGYPVGARLIALQVQDELLTPEEGQYLLGFCNNLSPAFCISYGIRYGIGSDSVFIYLTILYGSALLFAYLIRPSKIPSKLSSTKKQTSFVENIFQLIDVCIIDSFLIMIKLCGYLIIFSIISKGIFLLIPDRAVYTQIIIASLLENTNGLSKLTQLPAGLFRTSIGLMTLSFGGLCCILQTNSVISDTNLSIRKYILHKIIITIGALVLFFLWHFFRRYFF